MSPWESAIFDQVVPMLSNGWIYFGTYYVNERNLKLALEWPEIICASDMDNQCAFNEFNFCNGSLFSFDSRSFFVPGNASSTLSLKTGLSVGTKIEPLAHGMYFTLLFWVFQQTVSYAPRLVFLTRQLAATGSKFTPFWRVRKCSLLSLYFVLTLISVSHTSTELSS